MGPLPDGVRPEDIPPNRPVDRDYEAIWSSWWTDQAKEYRSLARDFEDRGLGGVTEEMLGADTPEEVHTALRHAESWAMERDLPGLKDDASYLLDTLPPESAWDAIEEAQDDFFGV